MRALLSLMIFFLLSCGDSEKRERCRSAEEAQMKCTIDYAEEYRVYQIPDWVKERCERFYPEPGCYLDSHKRH